MLIKNIAILFFILLSSCGGRGNPSPSSEKIAIICIGDSITQGWQMINGVLTHTPDQSYPAVLSRITNHKVNNYGIGGATSEKILLEQFPKALADKPSVIIVTDGINDVIKNVSIENYIKNNTEMAIISKQLGIKLFFINNVDWIGHNEKLVVYNEALRNVAKNNNVGFIDIKKIERPGWFCSTTDSHPCTIGYAEISEFVAKYL